MINKNALIAFGVVAWGNAITYHDCSENLFFLLFTPAKLNVNDISLGKLQKTISLEYL